MGHGARRRTHHISQMVFGHSVRCFAFLIFPVVFVDHGHSIFPKSASSGLYSRRAVALIELCLRPQQLRSRLNIGSRIERANGPYLVQFPALVQLWIAPRITSTVRWYCCSGKYHSYRKKNNQLHCYWLWWAMGTESTSLLTYIWIVAARTSVS